MKTRIYFSSALLVLLVVYFVTVNKFKNSNSKELLRDTVPGWQNDAGMMVLKQLQSRDIKDKRVLEAMAKTPRHLFVPAEYRQSAYNDSPLPIGYGQTISQPYIVALMTELLQLEGTEKILEIGTGSGYQAAILAQLADTVFSVEIICPLADSASLRLKRLKYHNVNVRCGDGYKGWPEAAPFDGIIVTAAPEEIPEELVKQLKIGGRMAVPVGKYGQELMLIIKNAGGITRESIAPVRFVPMVK